MIDVSKNIIIKEYRDYINKLYNGYETIFMSINNKDKTAKAIIRKDDSHKVCLSCNDNYWDFDKAIINWK